MTTLTTVFEAGLPILRGNLDADRIVDVTPLLFGQAQLSVGRRDVGWYERSWHYADLGSAAIAAALWDGTGQPLGWIRDVQTDERRTEEVAWAELFAVAETAPAREALGHWNNRLRRQRESGADTVLFVTTDYCALHPGVYGLDPDDLLAMPPGARVVSPETAMAEGIAKTTAEGLTVPADVEAITPDELRRLAHEAHARSAEFRNEAIALVALLDLADDIRLLRCVERRTWRGVARALGEGKVGAYRQVRWHPISNQLVGMAFCEVAAAHFGEDVWQGPWNGDATWLGLEA